MKFWDILLATAIFVGALIYLYRKIVLNRGCTCRSSGCSRNGSASGCLQQEPGQGFDECDNSGGEKRL